MVVRGVVDDARGGRWYCMGVVVAVVVVSGGLLAGGHLPEVRSPGLR